MAFYLVTDNCTERCFNIVSKDEWESTPNKDVFTVIESGDETYLKAMKKQLEATLYVRGDIEHLSPLKIARVVCVTSSGNTKFSVSPTITDPFHTDSEEEYFPPLENETSSDQSDDYPMEDDPIVIRRYNSQLQKIKKVIDFDDSVPSTSKETDSIEHAYDRSSERDFSTSTPISTSGEITISDKNIALDIYVTLHSGTFTVSLQRVDTIKPGKYILKGSLPLPAMERGHKCQAVDARKPVGYALHQQTDAEEDNSLVINLECCIQKGSVEGTFFFIKETNMNTSVLRYCDPFLDDIEEEKTSHDSKKPSTKMKLHFCLFCKELKTCIGRHYKKQHANEDRVKEIIEAGLSADTRNKARALMKKLRLEADHMYNRTVSLYDRIPVRKHNIQMLSNSVHCTSCSGLIASRNWSRHDKSCTGRRADNKRRLRYLQAEERISMSSAGEDDAIFSRVVSKMTKDNIREIIENDPLAKSLAIYLVKSQPKTHNLDNVRQHLRRTARLFIEVRKKTEEVEEMKDMFRPQLYSTVTSCVREMCSFNEPFEKRKSQLALAYGPLITSLINRLYIERLKSGVPSNDEKLEELNNLLKIHQEEFKVEITRQALVSSKHKRMAKKTDLPSTSDIEKLMKHTRRVGDQLYEQLQTAFETHAWIELGKSLLCQLLVFNRRRVGEMSRARVEDFMNRREVNSEYFQSLNRLEIILAEEFSVFTIMAKRTRPVNILVTKSQITQLELLISLRKQAGIPDDNVYLFASPTQADGYLKASQVLTYFANQCQASNPVLLKSTNLRKHVATMSQIFCLNDNEMKQLADFLGHDRDVHEKFYRLNESNTQITRLSKFLCTVGDKNVFQYRGKTIDELPFDSSNIGEQDDEESTDGEEEEGVSQQLPQSGVQCASPSEKGKQRKSYKLRRKSALKIPAKLRSPDKQKASPSKSPFTTRELLNMVTLPKPAKKLRWSAEEIAVMTSEFANELQNKCLPSLDLCGKVKSRNFEVLKKRDVHAIYCWVRNVVRKK